MSIISSSSEGHYIVSVKLVRCSRMLQNVGQLKLGDGEEGRGGG